MLDNNFIMALQSTVNQSIFINNIRNIVTDVKEFTKKYLDNTIYLYLIEGVYTKAFVDNLDILLNTGDNASTYNITIHDCDQNVTYNYGTLLDLFSINISSKALYSFDYNLDDITELVVASDSEEVVEEEPTNEDGTYATQEDEVIEDELVEEEPEEEETEGGDELVDEYYQTENQNNNG